jgi:hypothetical protein
MLTTVRVSAPETHWRDVVRSGVVRERDRSLSPRRCACGGIPDATGECAQCRAKRLAGQNRAVTNVAVGGDRRDGATSLLMARRFGHDFGRLAIAGGQYEIKAETRVARPVETSRFGLLESPEDKTVVPTPEETGGLVRVAETRRPRPDAGTALPPAVTPIPTCAYNITYANESFPGCPAGQCGAQIQFDVTGVSAIGPGCPSTLDGLRVTERVKTDNGCGPGTVETGAGCAIRAGGAVASGCTDTYGLCGPERSFPAAGCTEHYTQQLFVGGELAETRTITFVITKSAAGCGGTVTRT